jgi:hypothetical protein
VLGTPAAPRPPNAALEVPSAAPLVAGSVRTPKRKSTARRKSRPTLTSASDGPTQMALPQPADVTMDAREHPAGDSPPPAEEGQAGRESRSAPPASRDHVSRRSAALKESAAHATPGASRVLRAPTKGDPPTSLDRGYPWKTALWVAFGGGLLAAAVSLLSRMVR